MSVEDQGTIARPPEEWGEESREGRRGSRGGQCGSRPSKNNRQAHGEARYSGDSDSVVNSTTLGMAGLLDMSRRPVASRVGESLREECVVESGGELVAKTGEEMLKEWRGWMDGYSNAHIEFRDPVGELVRAPMRNSYHKEHANKYYAKVKGLEREIEEAWGDSLTTVMLTCSASNLTASGRFRGVVDHMTDIRSGWGTARKQLHNILGGYNWEYARVWEPHQSGFGHMHIALFIDDPSDEIEASDFTPFMRSYVDNCDPAAWKAHNPAGDSVSVSTEVHDLGCYISEYIGQYGDEKLTERPLEQQMFYAATWASNTRRVDFSNGAQEFISRDLFRQERGLDPVQHAGAFRVWRGRDETGMSGSGEVCGSVEAGSEASSDDPAVVDGKRVVIDPEAGEVSFEEVKGFSDGGGGSWSLDSVCRASGDGPNYFPPPDGGGGVSMVQITDGPDDVPADRGGAP